MLFLPAIAALTFLEILFFGVFFVALVIATEFDRRDHEEIKWWTLLAGIGFFAFWFWSDFTFKGLFDAALSAALWKTVALYLGIGLGYAIAIEFPFSIRRAAREFKRLWLTYFEVNKNRDPEWDMLSRGEQKTTEKKLRTAPELQKMFVDSHGKSSRDQRVTLKLNETGEPTPVVHKENLAQSLGAWMLFWPAYAISLILGDFLIELCRTISDGLVALSGRFVRFAFRDVFNTTS